MKKLKKKNKSKPFTKNEILAKKIEKGIASGKGTREEVMSALGK